MESFGKISETVRIRNGSQTSRKNAPQRLGEVLEKVLRKNPTGNASKVSARRQQKPTSQAKNNPPVRFVPPLTSAWLAGRVCGERRNTPCVRRSLDTAPERPPWHSRREGTSERRARFAASNADCALPRFHVAEKPVMPRRGQDCNAMPRDNPPAARKAETKSMKKNERAARRRSRGPSASAVGG